MKRVNRLLVVLALAELAAGCAGGGLRAAEPKKGRAELLREAPENVLEYHTSRKPSQRGILVERIELETVAIAPEGLAAGNDLGHAAGYAKWPTPLDPAGFRWTAVARSRAEGVYDRFYIDSNGDGSLADEKPLTPYSTSGGRLRFGPAGVTFAAENGPVEYHLNILCRVTPVFVSFEGGESMTSLSITVSSAGWYEGPAKAGRRRIRCMLIDQNSNGTFDDVSVDGNASDRISIEVGRSRSQRHLGNYVQINGNLHHVEVAREGGRVAFAAADVPTGAIVVAEGTEFIRLVGANGHFGIHLEGATSVLIPAGTWRVIDWRVGKTDERNAKWALHGSSGSEGEVVSVVAGGEATIDSGPPVISALNVKIDGKAYNFKEVLKGRHGESVMLMYGRGASQPPPPKLRITNADGTYDEILSFKYG